MFTKILREVRRAWILILNILPQARTGGESGGGELESVFGAVHELSLKFVSGLALKVAGAIGHDHPVGFLGALTARQRRDHVRLWTDVAAEVAQCRLLGAARGAALVALCRLLVAALRREAGEALVTACSATAVLALLKGRPTLLHRLGALPALVGAISDGKAGESQLAASALALQ
ncbi:hypothetical protein T484DRAFT_1762331, partial [Baffinella frigidus]